MSFYVSLIKFLYRYACFRSQNRVFAEACFLDSARVDGQNRILFGAPFKHQRAP